MCLSTYWATLSVVAVLGKLKVRKSIHIICFFLPLFLLWPLAKREWNIVL